MSAKESAILEAEIPSDEPSRLLIDIRLHSPAPAGGVAFFDAGDVRRAIRDGLRETLVDVQLERLGLSSQAPRPRRRWLGRVLSFVVSAGVGSVGTLLLTASHPAAPHVVVGSSAGPQLGAGSAYPPAPVDTAPGSQSAAPQTSPNASASTDEQAPGPAMFGLHEQ